MPKRTEVSKHPPPPRMPHGAPYNVHAVVRLRLLEDERRATVLRSQNHRLRYHGAYQWFVWDPAWRHGAILHQVELSIKIDEREGRNVYALRLVWNLPGSHDMRDSIITYNLEWVHNSKLIGNLITRTFCRKLEYEWIDCIITWWIHISPSEFQFNLTLNITPTSDL